jgi:hypothetical protein
MSGNECVEVEFLMWDDSFVPGTVSRGFVSPTVWHPVKHERLAEAAIAKYFGSLGEAVDKVKDVRLCVGDWRISIGRGLSES